MTGIDRWLTEVGTAALVGTARREPPDPPPELGLAGRDDAPTEHRLLASAAVADALTRGGAPLGDVTGPVLAAPDEVLPACGDQAAQLLHLLLTQPPVSRLTRDDLVAEWLRLADGAGQRVPHWLLPALLDHAASHRQVAGALGSTPGERGTWLAGLNDAWRSLAAGDEDPAAAADDWTQTWSTLPTAEAATAFDAGRRADPDAARRLLDEEWPTLSARLRVDALLALRHGLSPADEPLLERALDDRAASVRRAAAEVLARLPGSALSERMAGRLRRVVHVRGRLARHLEVDLPDAPDADAVRDGMTPPGRAGGPPPTTWLAEIVRGAPLDAWPAITGRPVGATLAMVRDKDVLAWIVEAVLDRRDTAWATALVEHGVADQRLVWLLPRDERTRLLVSWVRRPPAGRDLRSLLVEAPRPWPDELGRAVLSGIQRSGSSPALMSAAAPLLPAAIAPSLAPEVRAALDRVPPDATHVRRALTETLQLHAFRRSLTEAFT